MNYLEILRKSFQQRNSIVCMGMDPVLEDIPLDGSPYSVLVQFYESILNEMIKQNVYPGAVKPNYAFYAQYGIEGIRALQSLITLYRLEGLPVILDVKRGDIGNTAIAYSKEAFEFFSSDAITLSPFMGFDSIKPYMERYPDKGWYILTKTSNPGSADFQDLTVGNDPLYLYIARKIVSWHQPGLGSVVGATYPAQLADIHSIYTESQKTVPFLIPGVGKQGGSLKDVIAILKNGGDISVHRINSSSEINYAYKKNPGVPFAAAAVHAIAAMNREINELIDG